MVTTTEKIREKAKQKLWEIKMAAPTKMAAKDIMSPTLISGSRKVKILQIVAYYICVSTNVIEKKIGG